MTNVLDNIKNIVGEEIDLLNDKIFGINLLESLKFNLIPKLSNLEKEISILKNLDNIPVSQFEKNNNKIYLNFLFNQESQSQLKKEILKDTLFVVLKGGINFNFIEAKKTKNDKKINIFPLMGVCLSSQMIININSFKDTLFIELINDYSNPNIEKLEKDII